MSMFTPGCCCGSSSCIFAQQEVSGGGIPVLNAASADWDQVAGSWTVSNDLAYTGDANALLINLHDHPTGAATINIAVRQFTGGVADDTLRVIANYTDPDNYAFVELKVGSSPLGTLTLGLRIAGVETVLDMASMQTATGESLTLCIDGTDITATYTQAFLTGATISLGGSGTFTSPSWGLGTGGTMSGSAAFETLTVGQSELADCACGMFTGE